MSREVIIQIQSTPTHVCSDRAHHHDEHLGAFVGLEMPATHDAETDTFRVQPMEALLALWKANRIMGHAYWGWIYSTTHGLHDPFVFPAACCQVKDQT